MPNLKDRAENINVVVLCIRRRQRHSLSIPPPTLGIAMAVAKVATPSLLSRKRKD
jgi:hypothetical protein